MWDVDVTQSILENKSKDVNPEKSTPGQSLIQSKTPLKYLEHQMKTPIKELHDKKISESVLKKSLSKSPSKISSKIVIEDEGNKVGKGLVLVAESGDSNNNSDLEDLEDFDLIREMLPDLQHHARRLIDLLVSASFSISHVKEIVTIGTKMYKKKDFFLQALKLTASQYTEEYYINISRFSNRLLDSEIHTLFFANSALFLSKLYNPFSIPPKLEDLERRCHSLSEIDQLFFSIFDTSLLHSYVEIIELRTQLFIHMIWLNEVSKDYARSFHLNEHDELKKLFTNENERLKKTNKAYVNACMQRMEKIKHIRESSSTLETLIQTFPWYDFIVLMTEFVQKNVLNVSKEANKSSIHKYQDEKISNVSPFSCIKPYYYIKILMRKAQFTNPKNDKNFMYLSEQNEEYVFNSENEGEIPASDIKHLSQIVLNVENDVNKHIENNSQGSKGTKSFFDKQKDCQKITWESQNDESRSLKRSSVQAALDDSIMSIENKSFYDKKRRKYKEQEQLSCISKVENLQNTANPKEFLKTDALFFNTSPDTSSDSELSNSPLSSPSIIPSTSAHVAMELYKKSLAIQGLSSTLAVNKDTAEYSNDIEVNNYKPATDPYKDYSIVKQHLQLNKARRKEYKPQHRVPWSETEISCLMKAIEEYGSQWSFILSLYGPNGTLSRDLAERGQVQLKDKARNIKEEYIRAQWKLPPGFESITCRYD
ncbi:hypothetical protein PORY_000839 [Pneumocystis oryctolagi]|uniref:Uncharacterized protein n=1 Tax=Pneumocystis oryctolagi TaxID=42067 RepID=A0ACB7CIY9_9ASCO|nr:hypothetical protein PORY_000839 [Pneumocystis oryctolagi]